MKKIILSLVVISLLAKAEFIRDDDKQVVVDTTRNLMWQDEPYTKSEREAYRQNIDNGKVQVWEAGFFSVEKYPAKAYCKNLNFAGYDDWNLPLLDELYTIVDKSNNPTIASGFKNVVSDYYYATGAEESDTENRRFMDFSGKYNGSAGEHSRYIRCVRDTQSDSLIGQANNIRNSLIVAQKPKDTIAPTITITTPSDIRALKKKSNESRVQILGNATDSSGIAEVTVNGMMATIDTSGNFSGGAFLKVGENNITVSATDIYGNSASKNIVVERASGTVEQKAQITHQELYNEIANIELGKKYAVIIGINNYRDGITTLKTPVNDAKEVANILQNIYGFETILLADNSATKDGILETIENIAKKTKANDQMIIYYGGHGYFEKQTNTSYWLPSDAKSNSYVKGIKSKDITDLLKMSPSKQVLVVADSCYSGTMERNTNISWNSMNETRANFLKKQLKEPSRILLSSGGNEPVSDGNGKHSVFAGFFLKQLLNFDKNVFTAEELYGSYKEAVSGNSDQTPEYKTIGASGHESGDFVFVKK